VPSDVKYVSAASCPSELKCLAVTASSGAIGVVVTSDGGALWHGLPFPQGVSALSVSCPTARDCVAVGSNAVLAAGRIATTSNGGASWVLPPVPGNGARLYGVTCPSAKVCMAVGTSEGGLVLTTTNGGASWRAHTVF
jgi:photosystem II stability/assembly factor-like uncharacterized protein